MLPPRPKLSPEDTLTERLHIACIKGDAAALPGLLASGADPNRRDNVSAMGDGGYTALHYASLCRSPEAVRLLLQAGADPEVRSGDFFGETAMHCAGRGGNAEVIKLLSEAGCKVDAVNCWDWTPLHYAARS